MYIAIGVDGFATLVLRSRGRSVPRELAVGASQSLPAMNYEARVTCSDTGARRRYRLQSGCEAGINEGGTASDLVPYGRGFFAFTDSVRRAPGCRLSHVSDAGVHP